MSGRVEPCEHRGWANGRCLECGGLLPLLDEEIRRVRLLVLDFDGVLSSNDVWTDETGRESVRCWRGDGIGLARLGSIHVPVVIVTAEQNPVVPYRAAKLRIPCRIAAGEKLGVLWEWLNEMHVQFSEVAYVGNDVNDADCLRAVGLPIVVADAHPDVLPLARYVTRAKGGYGAVREVCDLIVRVKREPV